MNSRMHPARVASTAPVPLTSARRFQPAGRWAAQCRTRPDWLRVKPMKTPMAKSGSSRWVSASVASRSSAASSAGATTP
ncbi:hypothetical protein [Streptomyces sp. NPDC086777]|uniref:hypothetical protein n=1 Tax=Streptomyces sp. NPDC086777 TaxID=3154866 RepID=UPI003450AE60